MTLVKRFKEKAMNYLCQIWFETSTIRELSEEEQQKLTDDCIAYDDSLTESGHLVLARALRAPATAKTVRMSDGKISVTDGPFAEIKEHLGGIILIDAEEYGGGPSHREPFPARKIRGTRGAPGLFHQGANLNRAACAGRQ
jgi:hypothetical protein